MILPKDFFPKHYLLNFVALLYISQIRRKIEDTDDESDENECDDSVYKPSESEEDDESEVSSI